MATKWGIISAGKISSDFVTAMKCLPENEHKLHAVAARNLENAQNFAKTHKASKAYGSYQELLNDSDVDVVYIGTIHPHHFPVAKMCLEAGKPCLVEKPLCMNVKETKELIKLARSKKLFLMEAIWSRSFPLYQEMMNRIDNGEIGDVICASSSFGQAISEIPRIAKKEMGGGTTLDLGIYAIQFVSLIMRGEKPLQILAGGHLNDDNVDETACATLVYSNGRAATISTSMRTNLPNEGIVCGTKGTIKVHSPMWCPEKMESPSGPYTDKLTDGASYNFLNSEGLKFEAKEVRRCLLSGLTESPKVTLDETLLIAEIMETIRKAVGVTYPQD